MSRLDELERRIAEIEKHLGINGAQTYVLPKMWPSLTARPDCGCALNTVCGNAACPRRSVRAAGSTTCANWPEGRETSR